MDFLIHPCRWIDDEENVRTPPKLGRYWEIHPLRPRDFPRNSRFPSGFALGKSLGSREISWASGMDFPIPPQFWWSTDTIPPRPFVFVTIKAINFLRGKIVLEVASSIISHPSLRQVIPRSLCHYHCCLCSFFFSYFATICWFCFLCFETLPIILPIILYLPRKPLLMWVVVA